MSVSKAQRRAAAIALHQPDALYARNAGLTTMTLAQLAEFASTPERGLPLHAPRKAPR